MKLSISQVSLPKGVLERRTVHVTFSDNIRAVIHFDRVKKGFIVHTPGRSTIRVTHIGSKPGTWRATAVTARGKTRVLFAGSAESAYSNMIEYCGRRLGY
jgi:hypothetical protein